MATIPIMPIHHDSWMEWLNYRQFWTNICLGTALLAALAVIAVKVLSPPAPPYVWMFNSKGVPIGRILPAMGTADIPSQVMRGLLGDFVQNAFTIDSSFDEEKDIRMPKVYTMMPKHSQAEKALTDWYKADSDAHNPIVQCWKGWQEAQVQTPVQLPAADTYEAYVKTIWHPTNDQTLTSKNYRVIMHAVWARPTENNHLGLFVDYIDLREQQ